MLSKLKDIFKLAVESGLPLPHAYDPGVKGPSFRLLCAYISFLISAASVVALHFFKVEMATWTSIGFFSVCMVFYMLKTLNKAKLDLDDKSIELNSQEEK